MTAPQTSVDVAPGTGELARAPRSRLGRLTVWLGASWLLPVLTHLLHVDWLLPIVVLVLTAGLLRGGRTLLDRLILAIGLLLGTVCVAGLLYTAWPWGLSPVPVAGTAFTVASLIRVLGNRPIELPRPALSDGLAALATIGVTGYLARPYLTADATGRLALAMVGEDNARHASLFDAIRRLGGYAFGYRAADVPEVFDLMRFYPSGWHLTAGLLDGFVRSSSTDLGSMRSVTDHYIGFALASYGLFALAIIWAAVRTAGPLVRGWRALPLVAFLAGVLLYSDLPTMLSLGFVGELSGLTLLALTVAVVVRPLRSVREQLVLLSALVLGIGFSYYLLLPAAGLASLVWLYRYRARVRHHRGLLLGLATGVAVLSAVPPALGLLLARQSETITSAGGVGRVSRATLIAMAALIGAGILSVAGRRLRMWRGYVWVFTCVTGVAAALGAYQLLAVGHTTYYFEKGLHSVAVTLLVGLGGVALLFPAPRPEPARTPGQRVASAVPAVALSVAVLAVLGFVAGDSPYRPRMRDNPGRFWSSGEPGKELVPDATAVLRAVQLSSSDPAYPIVIITDRPYDSYRLTLFVNTLQRRSGAAAPLLYNRGLPFAPTAKELAQVLRRPGVPLVVVPMTAEATELVEDAQRAAPDLQLRLVEP